MNLNEELRKIRTAMIMLGENMNSDHIVCKNCKHEWDIDYNDEDPYLCHQCGYNNKTNSIESDKTLKWWANKLNSEKPKELDEFGVDQSMYPNFNLDTFKSLTSFNKRVLYCNQNLKRLGAGTSRIVYQVEPGTVLKLAKNDRGLQQNRHEANEYNQTYFSEVRTNVLDYDHENDLWVISEIATKITPEIFKQYTGFDFDKFDKYINLKYGENNGKKITDKHYLTFLTPDEKEKMGKDDFIEEVKLFMFNNNLDPSDVGRISSWGLVDRDGHKQVVLTDYGYTGKYS